MNVGREDDYLKFLKGKKDKNLGTAEQKIQCKYCIVLVNRCTMFMAQLNYRLGKDLRHGLRQKFQHFFRVVYTDPRRNSPSRIQIHHNETLSKKAKKM
jgi:hypothetical protein